MTPQIKQRIEQIRRGEVPEGYKKTKVGIVPEKWENKKLGELYAERNDVNCSDEQLLSITVDRGVIPRVQIQGKDNSSEDKSKYKHISKGDIGYNTMRMWQGVSALSQYDGIVSPAYTVLKPSAQVNALCFSYLFKLTNMINVFYRHSQGLVDDTRSLKYEWFKNIAVSVPSLPEQEKIAAILQTEDKVIELQQKKIDELKRLKKVYLSKMFPKKGCNVPEIRFPGFTDPWEQRKFGEVFDCTVPNNTLSRAELSYDEGTVLNVHYGDVLIKYGSMLDVQKDDIPRIPHRCIEDFNGALLQDGDVIIADTAEDETTGKACEIGNLQGSTIVSGLHTMVCRPRNRMALGYLGYYLNSNAYHHQLLPLMQGIKVLSLSRSNIQKTSVSYPSAMKEQQLIASYFSQLDHLITLHQRKLEEEQKKKKALMQFLLTGIVRVKYDT